MDFYNRPCDESNDQGQQTPPVALRQRCTCNSEQQTQKDRLGFGEAGPTVGVSNGRHSGIAHGASGPVARLGTNDLEGRRQGDRRWAGADETGRGAGLSVRLKPKAEQGQLVVVTPLQVALEEKLGRRVKPSVVYRLLDRHHWRKLAPTHDIPRPSQACKTNGKKTLPQELEAVLTAQAVRERPIRLMFQDEARFGRMARIRRCWAPAPLRPVVCNGYEREFTYVYGSVRWTKNFN